MRKIIRKFFNKLGYCISKNTGRDSFRSKFIKRFEVEISKELILRCFDIIKLLDDKHEDLTIHDFEDGVILSFEAKSIYVESGEEFLILKEVFLDQEYNFLLNEKCIVIDIGANIGLASIFFAGLENVEKIYAFEPVTETYECAKGNLYRNNIRKVKLFNFGLGREEREEFFLFHRKLKGNTGIRGRGNPNYKFFKDTEEKKVHIKNVSLELKSILSDNPGQQIVLKIDCEGSEYEIIDSLEESNLLSKIKIIMMEWHELGAEELESKLSEAGFIAFSRRYGGRSGMIYAIKN